MPFHVALSLPYIDTPQGSLCDATPQLECAWHLAGLLEANLGQEKPPNLQARQVAQHARQPDGSGPLHACICM